jgi:hypothetical protein
MPDVFGNGVLLDLLDSLQEQCHQLAWMAEASIGQEEGLDEGSIWERAVQPAILQKLQ